MVWMVWTRVSLLKLVRIRILNVAHELNFESVPYPLSRRGDEFVAERDAVSGKLTTLAAAGRRKGEHSFFRPSPGGYNPTKL